MLLHKEYTTEQFSYIYFKRKFEVRKTGSTGVYRA